MSLRLTSTFRQHIQRQQPSILLTRSYSATPSSTPNDNSKNNNQSLIPTWNDYFKIRSRRRLFEIASYAPSTIFPAAFTGSYFMQMQIDPTTTIIGMDPLMAAGIATVGAGFCGFLAGPVFGDIFFKLLNRKYVPEMDARDKVFYEHIKKNRADARLNSIRNPVPDYYGEKIRSVADYRSWLRKQREHYRKGVFGGSADDLDN